MHGWLTFKGALTNCKCHFYQKDVVKVIRSAGETLEELSKDAPSEDRINSTATKFLKSLEVRLQVN